MTPRCVLLIVMDCLRADHVSCYGYHRATTPTIDTLAERGLLWEQAHSLSSWTKPSVASLFTGLYPSQHGACEGIKRSKGRYTTTDALHPSHTTLAESLTAAGWHCGAFINNAQLGEFTDLHRGFATYAPQAGKADRLIGIFLEWLEANLDKPVFAYLHFLEAHWPYKPRRRHLAMFGGDRDTNHFRDFSARDYGRLRRAIKHDGHHLPGGQLKQMIQMYDGAVRRLDGKMKIILAMLAELGLRDQTAIIVTADHGEEFMEHGQIGHGHGLHNELTHVPLIAHIPGGPAGVRRAGVVSHRDLPGTIHHLAGLNGALPGGDLLSVAEPDQGVYSELRIKNRYTQAVNSGDWKLYRHYKFRSPGAGPHPPSTVVELVAGAAADVKEQLYNLKADPREQVDLASQAGVGDIRKALGSALECWWQEITSTTDQPAVEVEIDEQVVQRLRDLGYID